MSFALLANACSSDGSTAELEDRIAELETELNRATTTETSVEAVVSTTTVVPSTTTIAATTVTSETVPSTETIRQDFEDVLFATVASARVVLESDSPSVEPSALGSCSILYGDEEVCDIVREFSLHATPTHDIVETNSIVAPYRATAMVGYTLTVRTVDGDGLPLDQPTEHFLVFELKWEYVDGVWNLVDLTAPDTGFDLMALNLFLFEVPPSEYFALDH
jgi:hypothetical protein